MKTLLVLGCLVGASFALTQLGDELYAWKSLEFVWPDKETRDAAEKSGAYVPENNLPLGMERWKNKLFLTVPRWKKGVAASLNYVDLDRPNKTAALIPYPDLKANTLPSGDSKIADNAIVSTFRLRVDACDRLWVMDTGVSDILGEYKVVAKPALVIFDLKTDKLIRRYEFKETDAKESSFFANVVVEVTPETCDRAFAYVPDLGGYGLVVYSFAENDSWRVTHNFFHFDPLRGDLHVDGVNFQWTDGIFGMALTDPLPDGSRTMYFHALASTKEFSVNTKTLQNKTIATNPMAHYYYFKLEGERGDDTQASSGEFHAKTNVLFLTQLNRDGVACWNVKKPLNPSNLALVAQDKERLIFPNDIRFDQDDNLFILSDRMSTFIREPLDSNRINYRIFKVKVQDAIRGTVCE